MANVEECESALHDLARALHALDPEVRQRRIPRRSASVTATDLDVAWFSHLGPEGLAGIEQVPLTAARGAQLRFATTSDLLVEIGANPAAFPGAWLRGRVSVRAGWRDLVELRSVLL